ncbi:MULTISPECIES: aldo/keto reductase [Actinomadura]|uniref:Aldo/keto reductase n=1 Tax=Actinomadura litoris TaxID=2678616 RepID=A0A7K1KSL7_9ACTN|nr:MULTISPECIES: aldo/keto reductase [Actinomadura]MBT2207976.1 aldo/keto reductase [Actinomadura sp. NEAU-AAG7]MUN35181.1 aldo/keto reductase [Actinomadura litoris]
MRYRYMGDTGLMVSELCYGSFNFGGNAPFLGAPDRDWAEFGTVEEQEVFRLVNTALDAGVNFFDTADVYKNGMGEQFLGVALKNVRDRVVIGTKGRWRITDDPNDLGSSRHHLFAAVEASLRRLNTDYIDIYHLHGFDPRTSLDETLRALDDLVRSGKVRYLGVSNFAAWHLMKALSVSERRNLARVVTYQGYYNLAARELEREIVPLSVDQNVGITVWSPLAGGFLTGKYRRGEGRPEGSRLANATAAESAPLTDEEQAYDIVDELSEIAAERGVTVPQVALNWVLAKPGITAAVVGASKPSQLEDNLNAMEWTLTEAEVERLDKVSEVPAPYPYWHIRTVGADRRLPGDVYP